MAKDHLSQSTQQMLAGMGVVPITVTEEAPAGWLRHFVKNWELITRDRWVARYSRRLPARARCRSETVARATPPTVQPGTDSTIRTGSRGSVYERGSDRTIGSPRGRVSIHPLPSPKKGWRSKTGHQSQGAQRVRGSATLQDGGHTHTKKPPTTRRLASENRSEGRIFCHHNSPRQQETPEIPTREQDLRIHLPPLRSCFGTMSLYQDPQTSSSSRTRVRDACDSLHRRHPPNGENQGGITGPGRRSSLLLQCLGFTINTEKTIINPTQSLVFLGFTIDTTKMELSLPPEKIKKIRAESRKLLGAEHVSARSLARLLGKMNAIYEQRYPPSPPVLSPSPDGPVESFENSCTGLRIPSEPLLRQQARTCLVGLRDGEMEREINDDPRARPCDRFRCLTSGMGSDLSGSEHGRTVVNTRGDHANT